MVVMVFFLLAGPGAAAAGGGDPAVDPGAAPALAGPERSTPWLSFGLDHVSFLRYRVLENPLWQYIASLLYIVLAFYAAKGLDALIQMQLRKWAERYKGRVNELLLNLVRGPVKIVVFVILVHVGLQLFSWPSWCALFISNGLKILVACSLTYVVLKAADLLIGLWQQRVEGTGEQILDKQLVPVIQRGMKIFVVIVAILVTCQNLGMNVTGLLASLSIGGLAIGLAAQDTLSNLFGAVAIFTDKPFRVGDRVQLDAIDGTVEGIGLRSTRIRNLDGYLVTVPNRTMANASIVNVTHRPTIKTVMNIGITYDTPAERIQKALQILEEIYRPHPQTHDLLIGFNKFEASSLNLLVVHWCKSTDFKVYLVALQAMNLALKKRFDEERINFAFPTQTLYVKQDSEWRVSPTQPEPPGASLTAVVPRAGL